MNYRYPLALTLLFCAATLPALAVCPLADPADCVYVDDNCVSNPGSGTEPDPFCTIVDAYDSVVTTTTPLNPATILVMPGTYSECPDLALTFDFDSDFNDDRPVHLVADAWLTAGSPVPNLADASAFETVALMTTISGLGVCDSDIVSRTPALAIAGSGASVRGFTITSGGLSGIEGLGPVSIESNLIAGNEGDVGGGILMNTVVCAYGDVNASIANNVIRDNLADDEIANDPKAGFDDGFGDGGGIFIQADGAEAEPGCFGGQSLVDVRENLIFNNIASNANISEPDGDTFAAGGGIDAETFASRDFFEPNLSQARIVIEGNVIRQNAVNPGLDGLGLGGGIFANQTDSSGMKSIEIRNNQIGPNNVASSSGDFGVSFGGGVSSNFTAFGIGRGSIILEGNTIDQNQADVGAGADVLTIATSLFQGTSMSVQLNRNLITNNASVFEGGGLNLEFNTARSIDTEDRMERYPLIEEFFVSDLTEFVVSNNIVRGNSSGSAGGGAVLRPSADSDEFPICIPSELRPSTAIIELDHNLFEDNTATDVATFGAVPGCSDLICEINVCAGDDFCCAVEWDQFCADAAVLDTTNCDCNSSNCCVPSGQQVIGPGILVLPTATGQSYAAVIIDDSTVVDNHMIEPGFVGGVEIAAGTFDDCNGGFHGEAEMDVNNTIVAFNDADGIGGPPVSPLFDLTVNVRRCSVFGNGDSIPENDPDTNYEPTIFPGGVPAGNIIADPLLDGSTFVPGLCSPAYDVGSCNSDPAQICFSDDDCDLPTPGNGVSGCNREGAGYYGSPDINGDDALDGVDLLRFSSAFGTTDGVDLRYTSEADVDGDGLVDGNDLPFIAPLFGQECVQN